MNESYHFFKKKGKRKKSRPAAPTEDSGPMCSPVQVVGGTPSPKT